MVYIYGLAPPENWINNMQYVGETTEFQIGEIGGFNIHRRILDNGKYQILSETEMAKRIREEMKAKGDAIVLYMEIDRVRFWGDWLGKWSYDYKIKCVFKGSPIAWFVVAGILIGLGLITIVAAPLIWKYGGLDPEDVSKYLDAFGKAWNATWQPIIIIAIIAVLGMFFLFGGSISKKGMSAKGR